MGPISSSSAGPGGQPRRSSKFSRSSTSNIRPPAGFVNDVGAFTSLSAGAFLARGLSRPASNNRVVRDHRDDLVVCGYRGRYVARRRDAPVRQQHHGVVSGSRHSNPNNVLANGQFFRFGHFSNDCRGYRGDDSGSPSILLSASFGGPGRGRGCVFEPGTQAPFPSSPASP